MVKVNSEVAAQHHAAVLQAASELIREHGIAKASVARIAKNAGLTHGAVYSAFPSKDALVAKAIERDFTLIVERIEVIQRNGLAEDAFIEAYLSTAHRDDFAWGCPAGALTAEIAGQPDIIQKSFLDGALRALEAIRAFAPHEDYQEAKERALGTVCMLIGGLMMARAVRDRDPELSTEVLSIVRRAASQVQTR